MESTKTLRDILRPAANLSMLFDGMPLLERPAAIVAAGFQATEFSWAFDGPTPPPSKVDELVAAITEAGLGVACLNFDGGDRSKGDRGLLSNPEAAERFRANVPVAVEMAGALNCPVMHAPFGNRVKGLSWSEQREHAVRQLAHAAEAAAEVGATVVIEAQNPNDSPDFPLRTTASAADIAATASRYAGIAVKITYDAYHMLQTEGRLLETVAEHLDSIAHIQIGDHPGRGAPGTGGNLPFVEFLTGIVELGYDGYVGLEYKPSGPRESSWAWLDMPITTPDAPPAT